METVQTCQKIREKNGKAIYAIGLTDGRGGESFATAIPIGTPVSDLIIEETQYGTRFKLKSQQGGGGGYRGGQSRSGNESFALSYAKDLVVGGKLDISKILTTADKFYTWLESKRPLPAAAPPASAPPVTTRPAAPEPPPLTVNDDLPF